MYNLTVEITPILLIAVFAQIGVQWARDYAIAGRQAGIVVATCIFATFAMLAGLYAVGVKRSSELTFWPSVWSVFVLSLYLAVAPTLAARHTQKSTQGG